MKVKATMNLGTADYPHHPLVDGEVAEVPQDVAKKMIARRHAVEIIEPKPELKPEPEAEPEADKKQSATAVAEKTKSTKK